MKCKIFSEQNEILIVSFRGMDMISFFQEQKRVRINDEANDSTRFRLLSLIRNIILMVSIWMMNVYYLLENSWEVLKKTARKTLFQNGITFLKMISQNMYAKFQVLL